MIIDGWSAEELICFRLSLGGIDVLLAIGHRRLVLFWW